MFYCEDFAFPGIGFDVPAVGHAGRFPIPLLQLHNAGLDIAPGLGERFCKPDGWPGNLCTALGIGIYRLGGKAPPLASTEDPGNGFVFVPWEIFGHEYGGLYLLGLPGGKHGFRRGGLGCHGLGLVQCEFFH